jgi:predicted metal-dependent hydrolase
VTDELKKINHSSGLTVNIARVPWRRSRYILRLRPDGSVAALIPPRWGLTEIEKMLHRHRRWMQARALELKEKTARCAAEKPTHPATLIPPAWHQKAARALLPARAAHWAQIMELTPGKINVSSARRHWGLCNARGDIRLSWRLILVPAALADYVVIHELCHLKHMNHGPKFWALVARYVPDYVAKRRALNKLGALLD